MARANRKLIEAIKATAEKLRHSKSYQWGHMGACNCGHLAQQLTNLTKSEIHDYAMRGHGDWTEQIEAFCPTSSMPMDLLISNLITNGLALEDLINLERLKDQKVLRELPPDKRGHLSYNSKEDVALYLEAWASVLERQITKEPIPRLALSS